MSRWIKPRLNWQPYDFVKYGDINRIMGNCNFLFEHEPQYVSALPTSYTRANFLWQPSWQDLLNALYQLQTTYAIPNVGDARTWTAMTPTNFFNVENLERLIFSKKYSSTRKVGWTVSKETLMDDIATIGG